jgi:parallel beta-helix repeat protein
MKKALLSLSCLLLLLLGKELNATNVGGTISTNTTWTSAGSPYVITSSITVNSGITLTIQTGVTVQVNDGFSFVVNGTLTATGTTFTSSSASPTAGKWGGFILGDNTNKGILNFTSCQITYSSYGVTITRGILTSNSTDFTNLSSYGIYSNGYAVDSAIINLNGGSISNIGSNGNCVWLGTNTKFTSTNTNFSNAGFAFVESSSYNGTCTISGGTTSGMSNSAFYILYPNPITITNHTINGNCVRGLYLNNANVTASGLTITSCGTPIEYAAPSILNLSGSNNFSGNTNKYVYMNHTSLTSSMTLPTVNIPYYFPNGYTIYAPGRLQINDDNILKFNYSGINVNSGKLVANASVGKQIYFTSYKDDNLGGDANGDQNATAPSANNWTGIDFPANTIDSACILRRVSIRYADRAIEINSASPTIDSCSFNNNTHGIYINDDSYPVINGCTFAASSLTPIAMTFDADPLFTGNIFSFQDNQYDAIGLLGSSIVANATLKLRSVTTSPNVTYVMLGDITIPSGKSLTINKGIVIKSINNYKIHVLGSLFANGTADSNIVMTSVRDDNSGKPGDTNKDGTQTSPTKGDFGGVVFAPGSLGTSILNFCDIRYAQLNQTYYSNQYQAGGAITIVNSNPTISNCKINNCNIGIMAYQASNPNITNNQVINSSSTPIAISVSANPIFSNNTFTNAGYLGLGIIGETVTANGIIKKRDLTGYTNITYVLLDNLTISANTNVEVESGVVIKMRDYVGINVNGGLKFSGKGTSRIVVTSVKDDNAGNPFDTNGDGNATSPSNGNWGSISYLATSDDSYSAIRSVDLKYAGYPNNAAIIWNNAAAAMDDCNLTNINYYGLYIDGNSNPVIDSVQINSCSADPIAMSLLSDPTFSNIQFSANGTKGIKIIDVNLSSNATLKKRSLSGISNIAYFVDNLTINSGATLTISPGVVIKSQYSYYNYKAFTVDGAIIAQGTNSEKIIFTSKKDDSNGGDYNNDGNNSSPDKSDWNGITINASASPSSFKNCIFRYGAGRYNNEGVVTYNNNLGSNMDSCTIEQTNSTAIGIIGTSNCVISNSQLLNINNVPVMMAMFANPTFNNNSLSNVATVGIGVIAETYSQTATIPIRNFGGYNNITYIGLGTYYVNAGTTLTIPAGVVFKGGNWQVNGYLKIAGTNSQPVVFTCVEDDAYGNPLDTKQNGSGVNPLNNYNSAEYIRFNDISNDSSSVKNAIFRYGQTGIYMNSASPKIDSCKFNFLQTGVGMIGVSQPVLNNSVFDNLQYYQSWNMVSGYAMSTSILSYPSSASNNTISGKTMRGIYIMNETLSQDVTLSKRNFGGIANIPYIFDGFTIGSGAVLTLAPGIVCKFNNGGQLTVNKGLIAEGGSTADSNIVLTTIYDDFYGGDTNLDSNYTTASNSSYNWTGISIESQALNAYCKFKNVIVKHAYYGIQCNSKSPSISNCLFKSNYDGIKLSGASNPVVNNCDFVGNYNYGINNVDKSFTIDAKNCWWNDNNGPTHALNTLGQGDKVTDGVTYNPFRTNDALNPISGDVSLNGKVQAYDAALILQNAVALTTFNAIQNRVGDVSASGGISAFDASLILQYVVEKIRSFPSEELQKKEDYVADGILTIGNKNLSQTEDFQLPISIENVSNAFSLDIKLKYNQALFKSIVFEAGPYLQNKNFLVNIDSENGYVYLSVMGGELLENNGLLGYLKVSFKDKNTASIESKIEVLQFLGNETDLKYNISGGVIDLNSKITAVLDLENIKIGSIYPNPFTDCLHIPIFSKNGSTAITLHIFDMTGRIVFEKHINSDSLLNDEYIWDGKATNGKELSNGTYLMSIEYPTGKSIRKVQLGN